MPNPTGGNSAGHGAGSVGFFGKLPGAGDFVQRRLPPMFVDRWDRHFEQAVAASRERLGERWHDTWHASPAWRFVLAPGVCTESAWAGVMAAAADRVGRCFPMVMAASLGTDAAACGRTLRESQRWFDALEQTHAQARYHGADADTFDARLVSLPGPLEVTRSDPAAALQGVDWRDASQWCLPLRVHRHDELFLEALWAQVAASGAGWCLWWTHGSGAVPASALLTQGLPVPTSYAAFLDAGEADASWRSLRAYAASPLPASAPAVAAATPAASAAGVPAPAPIVPDDVTVPGFGRAAPAAPAVASTPVVPPAPVPAPQSRPQPTDAPAPAPASVSPPPKSTVFRSPDGAFTMLAADEGAHDPRCIAAASAHAVAAAMQPGEFSGGMHHLRERLLARHPALHASSEDLIDPLMEEAAVMALHTTGRWAALLRLGTGEAWQWRRGQMRLVFAQTAEQGDDVDALLFSRSAPPAVGLGGAGAPQCDEIICAVEPGDRFLLLVTRRLVGLDQGLIAQALALPTGDDARAHIAHACALGTEPSPWPVAVVEIAS